MKANEAPEKIYIDPEVDPMWDMDKRFHESDIEYTRTDAFIEKAAEWLKNNTYGYLIEKWGETDIDREELVDDFKKAMRQ